jgi:hypothetical protein
LSPPTSANVASAGKPAGPTSVGFVPSQIIRDSADTAVAWSVGSRLLYVAVQLVPFGLPGPTGS